MAAVVPIDAPMLSWLRMRQLEDAETGMALATVRAALLLYGVRGVAGMQWLSKELASPGVLILETTRPRSGLLLSAIPWST